MPVSPKNQRFGRHNPQSGTCDQKTALKWAWAALLLVGSLFVCAEAVAVEVEKSVIKRNVDSVVRAINSGSGARSFSSEAYAPYIFIMDTNGKLIVHPYLAGEYLQEKARPIYNALRRATSEGIWVTYHWKGVSKESYVRKTNNNLTVGSGN